VHEAMRPSVHEVLRSTVHDVTRLDTKSPDYRYHQALLAILEPEFTRFTDCRTGRELCHSPCA